MRNKSRDKNPQRSRLRETRRLAVEQKNGEIFFVSRSVARYKEKKREKKKRKKKLLARRGLKSRNIPEAATLRANSVAITWNRNNVKFRSRADACPTCDFFSLSSHTHLCEERGHDACLKSSSVKLISIPRRSLLKNAEFASRPRPMSREQLITKPDIP